MGERQSAKLPAEIKTCAPLRRIRSGQCLLLAKKTRSRAARLHNLDQRNVLQLRELRPDRGIHQYCRFRVALSAQDGELRCEDK